MKNLKIYIQNTRKIGCIAKIKTCTYIHMYFIQITLSNVSQHNFLLLCRPPKGACVYKVITARNVQILSVKFAFKVAAGFTYIPPFTTLRCAYNGQRQVG